MLVGYGRSASKLHVILNVFPAQSDESKSPVLHTRKQQSVDAGQNELQPTDQESGIYVKSLNFQIVLLIFAEC